MLIGKELLEKVDELGGRIDSAVIKACGYSYSNKDNKEIALTAGFSRSYAEAKYEEQKRKEHSLAIKEGRRWAKLIREQSRLIPDKDSEEKRAKVIQEINDEIKEIYFYQDELLIQIALLCNTDEQKIQFFDQKFQTLVTRFDNESGESFSDCQEDFCREQGLSCEDEEEFYLLIQELEWNEGVPYSTTILGGVKIIQDLHQELCFLLDREVELMEGNLEDNNKGNSIDNGLLNKFKIYTFDYFIPDVWLDSSKEIWQLIR